jgi:hypothetical protein
VVDSCEQGNEHSGYIKGREFLRHLNYCELLKDVSSTYS